jgi:hypothetical protein
MGESITDLLLMGDKDDQLETFEDAPGQGSLTINVASGPHEVRIEPTVIQIAGAPARVENPAVRILESSTIVFTYGLIDVEATAFELTTAFDEKTYTITGKAAGVTPTKLAIIPENSLVRFELDGDNRGEIIATLPKDMISGIYSARTGSQEVPFDEIESGADSTTLSFSVPEGSKSVELYGTFVVPEFPFVGLLISITMGLAVLYLLIQKKANLL